MRQKETRMDKHLVFEHNMREYVRDIQEELNNVYYEAKGNEYGHVDIRYDNLDGGKWTIFEYVNGSRIELTGAELRRVADAWIETVRRTTQLKVLRTLIVHDGKDNALC